ncbi:MAG: anti-sigma factor, partial [Candidatus Sulfomarinibacteraceae bacterium]
MRTTTLTRNHHLRTTLLVLATLLAAAAPMTAAADTAYLELSSDGLEPLGPGYVYEGWLIVDGAAVSAGRFSVTADGSLSRSDFAIEVADLDAVTTYVLTIEPAVDPDPGPSHTHILAGDFSGGAASLTAGHGAALGDDFSAASGPYILNAPSGGGSAADATANGWGDTSAGPGPPPPH